VSDPVKQLRAKFDEKNRYANFGPVIRKMRICGFRGITDLIVGFDSPICALSGLNGSGKSTVGQLSVCAYKKPSTSVDYRRYYVKEFFPVSVADQNPFDANERAEYAVAESFFATLKVELLHDLPLPTRAAVESMITEYIEDFYNVRRRHSSLDYLSPMAFELQAATREEAEGSRVAAREGATRRALGARYSAGVYEIGAGLGRRFVVLWSVKGNGTRRTSPNS